MTVPTAAAPKISCRGARKVYSRDDAGELVALERTDLVVSDQEFLCPRGTVRMREVDAALRHRRARRAQ